MSGQSDLKEINDYLHGHGFVPRVPRLYSNRNAHTFGARLDRERKDEPFILWPYTKRSVRCSIVYEPSEAKAVFVDVNPTIGDFGKPKPEQRVLRATFKVRDEAVIPMHKHPFLALNREKLMRFFNNYVEYFARTGVNHLNHSVASDLKNDLPNAYNLSRGNSKKLDELIIQTSDASPGELLAGAIFANPQGNTNNQNLATVVGLLQFIDESREYFL